MINPKEPLEKILADLISVESVTGNETILANEVQKGMKSLGLLPIKREGNNLIYRLEGVLHNDIALVGHLDTVPVDSEEQFKPFVKNNMLYGRGAVDMKAGVACMIKAALDYSTKLRPKNNLYLVFYEGEEGPLPNGLTKLLNNKSLDNLDFAFVLEPTSGIYDVGCLGSITAKVDVKGKSAHSASPELGRNAIYLSRTVEDRVKEVGERDIEFAGHSFPERMSITQIQTSNAHNMVPGNVSLTLNYRFAPNMNLEQAKERIISVVKPNKSIAIEFLDESPACLVTSGIDKYLLSNVERRVLRGWTDIAQLNANGIPAVNYGPGNMNFAHTAKERISIKGLDQFYQSLKNHL